jgi:hypothetical protein
VASLGKLASNFKGNQPVSEDQEVSHDAAPNEIQATNRTLSKIPFNPSERALEGSKKEYVKSTNKRGHHDAALDSPTGIRSVSQGEGFRIAPVAPPVQTDNPNESPTSTEEPFVKYFNNETTDVVIP